jgi:CRISPR-associated protein Csx3
MVKIDKKLSGSMDNKDVIKFQTIVKEEYVVVHFELQHIILPEILKKLTPPKVDNKKGVVLSGRGPIWLYCFLTHFYHPTKFIAVYDPRIGGGVIVETHTPGYSVGDTLEVSIE